MIGNKYRGQVYVEIGGNQKQMKFTWDAIGKLQSKFGLQYNQVLSEAIEQQDVKKLATIIGIGTGLPAKNIMDDSPPILPMAKSVLLAIDYAYYGPDGPPEEEESENPPQAWIVTLWRKLTRPLFGRK